jgi:hypothetical protein
METPKTHLGITFTKNHPIQVCRMFLESLKKTLGRSYIKNLEI